MREVRKEVERAAPSDGVRADEYTFDDRRRLLLALLVLFRSRPTLLAASNIDIFNPVYDFITGGSSEDRRGLAQPGLMLFHSTIITADMADFVTNEHLITTLSSLMALRVPSEMEGEAGTDPRLCALMLLLRLVKLSSEAVKMALEMDLIGQLGGMVLGGGGVWVGVPESGRSGLHYGAGPQKRGTSGEKPRDSHPRNRNRPRSQLARASWQHTG